MKWLLVIAALTAAVLFVPIGGRSLWSRGVRDWLAQAPAAARRLASQTEGAPAHSPKAAHAEGLANADGHAGSSAPAHASPAKRAVVEGPARPAAAQKRALADPPKESLGRAEQDSLRALIARSQR